MARPSDVSRPEREAGEAYALDGSHATTRLLSASPPALDLPEDSALPCRLRLPEAAGRRGEGGLRLKGHFKRSRAGRPVVSIVTVAYNAAATLEDTIRSVLAQGYDNVEYIVVDGGSTDGTLELLRRYDAQIDYWVSEPDAGMYDAMNKGLTAASGTYVGTLNSDDFFATGEAVSWLVEALSTGEVDAVYASLEIVGRTDTGRVLRRYRAGEFRPWMLRIGVMPAHPTFYCRRALYERFGLYKTDYRVAADYEMMVRVIAKGRARIRAVRRYIVKMRAGGLSNNGMRERIAHQFEIVRACRENGYYTNLALLALKVPIKLWQFAKLPRG